MADPAYGKLHLLPRPHMLRRMQAMWITPETSEDRVSQQIARDFALPQCLAEILVRRGFDTLGASSFLDPRLKDLSAPELLPGISEAVDRLNVALRRKEKIVLYGDYDVDGVASLALLWRILRGCGAEVECFLPLRAEEGYGLSEAGLNRCLEDHSPKLLIAVDCGTNSVKEISWLRDQGVDVLVLDHHEPSGTRPPAVAVVNPKLGKTFHYLCSAGVVFKLAHALLKLSPQPGVDLKDYLDLVALATVADMVPLVEENRILVRRGLRQMGSSRWLGLHALMEVSAVNGTPRGGDIGFRLGPRINASGRLGTAQESLRLLTTDDAAEARRIAASLENQNRERQTVERAVTAQAEAWVDGSFDAKQHASIVAGSRDWHQGVVGIVAARLMRRYHRPTIVVGFDDSGNGKGSGRSIEGFSLVEALGRCASLLERFGGHEMAAGVSLREERFADFRDAFEASARAASNAQMLTPRIRLDACVELHELGHEFLDAQERLEPFGLGNLQPSLWCRAVHPISPPRILKEKHFRLEFAHGRSRITAMFFNAAENPLPRPPWDIAFRLERNEFNGRNEPQIHVIAIRSAA